MSTRRSRITKVVAAAAAAVGIAALIRRRRRNGMAAALHDTVEPPGVDDRPDRSRDRRWPGDR